ncbi:MAG TPA: ABC transporter permease [Acidimicrobiia bacterium]|nr:ABC transporter permease [Acidimicrobiia bacterium]
MTDLLPFLVVGITSGSLYGLAGVGLVLTYRTSGVFNFAHGAVAAVGAFVFYELHHEQGLPWPLAAAICLAVAAPLLGLVLERLARGLAGVAPALQIVATIGLLLFIQGVATGLYGSDTRFFPKFLPTRTLRLLGANVGVDQLITIAVAGVASAVLAAFLQRRRAGIAMRAVVDNPSLLDLSGWSPTAIRRLSWVIGAVVATASGILIAPAIGLDALLLTLLIVQAFGAAAIGRFTSLPLTYLGGMVVGVAAAVLTKEIGRFDLPWLAGLPPSVPFIVLFAVLLATPRGRFGLARETGGTIMVRAGALPARDRLAWSAAIAGAVLVLPGLVGPRLPVYTNAAVFVVVFVGMVLLVSLSGQVSLCQAAFAALGATTFSHLAEGAGLPWLVALLGAGIVTVPLGALVAIPAIRLSGLYLALATFGLGILLERMVFATGFMFGETGTRVAPRPGGFGSDRAFFYVVAVVAAAACAGLLAVRHSRLGRLLGAMGDAPIALATTGVSVNMSRVLVFCLSAFLTGVAGALFAAASGSASAVAFSPLQSLVWLAVLVAGGSGLVKAAVVAAVAFAVVPAYQQHLFAEWGNAIFGAVAILAALGAGGRFSLGARLGDLTERWGWRAATSPVRARMRPAEVGT